MFRLGRFIYAEFELRFDGPGREFFKENFRQFRVSAGC